MLKTPRKVVNDNDLVRSPGTNINERWKENEELETQYILATVLNTAII